MQLDRIKVVLVERDKTSAELASYVGNYDILLLRCYFSPNDFFVAKSKE